MIQELTIGDLKIVIDKPPELAMTFDDLIIDNHGYAWSGTIRFNRGPKIIPPPSPVEGSGPLRFLLSFLKG